MHDHRNLASWAHRRPLRISLLLLAIAVLLAMPAAAHAAPLEPTMSTSALEARLEASGTLPGYFKTVVKGATIETIPATVLAVTVSPNAALYGGTDQLILFEATGPVTAAIGGIASGMSGSPVFVDDDGTDKLIGAVSYGDIFTRGGLGLATPIQDMIDIEDRNVFKSALALPEPVRTSSGLVETIVVARSAAEAAKTPRAARTAVMAPLTTLQLGGIPESSKPYARFAKKVAEHGFTLKAAARSAYDPTFETTLTGGASVAALASRGSIWYGGAGTVTYVATDTLLAFGHPMFWEGDVGLSLTNAWVHAIWASDYSPYKLISPTKLRGSFTQDRAAGLGGRLDQLPDEIPVEATATLPSDGIVATSTSFVSPWLMGQMWYSDIPAMSAYIAVTKAVDDAMFTGSALTTSTVVVSDETTTYTVTRPNMQDSGYDASYESIWDLYDIIDWLTYDPTGLHPAHIESVAFEASLSPTRAAASVIDLDVPGGLSTGDNRVRVSTLAYGVEDTQTVDATLTIPSPVYGRPMGTLLAKSANSWVYGVSGYGYAPARAATRRGRTVADRVADLQDYVSNNTLIVRFVGALPPTSTASRSRETTVIETTVTTPWVLAGYKTKRTSQIAAYPSRMSIPYGRAASSFCVMWPVSRATTVTVYRRAAGQTSDTTYSLIPVTSIRWGDGVFTARLGRPTKNTRYTLDWDGDSGALGTTSTIAVGVRCRVGLTASLTRTLARRPVRLTARIVPSNAGGEAVFQRKVRGRWVTFARKPMLSTGVAISSFTPPARGTYPLRVWHHASATNSPGFSPQVTVTAL
jgi:hypothetical protein